VGIAHNRLLAKLASARAKLSPADDACAAGGGRVFVASSGAEVASLLTQTRANKLPGLGSKGEQLAAAGWGCVAELQRASVDELQAALGLSSTAARLVSGPRDHTLCAAIP
jgi:nucleotidyltransferase/DNA polymerase involved in DNA repair